MLPLRSLRSKWTLFWNGRQHFQVTSKILLLAEGKKECVCLFPCGNGEFCSCWHHQLLCFSTQYFWSMFYSEQDMVVRNDIQPARWQDWFPKMSERHLEKNLSAVRRVQAISLDCLLHWSQSRGVYAIEAQLSWRAVTWDFNWHGSGPACPQIGSISCLSSENRASHVFCCCFSFVQRNWKWQSFSCSNFRSW